MRWLESGASCFKVFFGGRGGDDFVLLTSNGTSWGLGEIISFSSHSAVDAASVFWEGFRGKSRFSVLGGFYYLAGCLKVLVFGRMHQSPVHRVRGFLACGVGVSPCRRVLWFLC